MYNAQTTKDRIKKICKDKKINANKMLIDCSLGANAIQQINDTKGMASFSLAKIADYLDCSVDYLLGRTDFPHLIIEDDKGNKNFVLIEAMTPNHTSDIRIAAAPPVTPAKANQEEDKIDIT